MVKIVGKFLICVLSCVITFVRADISMTIRGDGGSSNQVVIGQPFIIDVLIDNVYGSVQTPTIKGLSGFPYSVVGMYSSSINGKSAATYSYQVRIDKVGSFVLGPAVVTHQQKELISNELKISVVKDIGIVAQKNKSQEGVANKAFLRLMVDQETVVVGQKMSCTIRFYYEDPSLSLHNIGIPNFEGFDIKDVGKLETGVAEIDGSSYRYAQWRWDMYPTQPGEFIIPAYHADYDIPAKENNHLFGGLFMFINNRVDRKRVYSNAVAVSVVPLPAYDKPVHAIGSFERISAEIKPGVAKEGEGMVLTIEVEGNGNLQPITLSPLNIPQGLRYYDSNVTISNPDCANELSKKKFEFIVQGMQAGDYEIPEQLFTYFDVERHSYATLRTCPLRISIMPGAVAVTKKDTISLNNPVLVAAQTQDEIADITIDYKGHSVCPRKAIPWWLFCLLFLMSFVYLSYPSVRDKYGVLSGNSRTIMRRRAFKNAAKKIAYCVQHNESSLLHSIFMELFHQLEKLGITIKLQGQEWQDFCDLITHAAYGHDKTQETDQLCRMAQQWLKRLEKNI